MQKKEKDVNKNYHKDHRKRMRAKILANGFESLEDHEKLEVLMYYTIPMSNTNEQGHRLIEKFGSFSAVLDASIEEIEKVDGVGHSTAYFLSLLPQIFGSYMNDKKSFSGEFKSIDEIGKYLTSKFYGCNDEKLYMICLDAKNKIVSEKEIGRGNSSLVFVDYQEITKTVFSSKCHSIALAHNHPAGVCIPSGDDVDASKNIRNFLENLNVRLLQSFVIVNDSYRGILD